VDSASPANGIGRKEEAEVSLKEEKPQSDQRRRHCAKHDCKKR
jgi:hypothetical protein